jgi:2-keto-3-deoxy-L-rhamnonate aldolase RhmA
LRNKLREKLRQGRTIFGITLGIRSPEIAEAVASLGFDWINFDTQHTFLSIETIESMMAAISYSECVPVIRVISNDLGQINRALDAGAHAVIVPLVNSKGDAERAVKASLYSPHGGRSWGPRRAAMRDPEYTETANKEIMIIPQIETDVAVDRVEEIVTTDGIEAVFVGPMDLSMSLGVFRQFESPKYLHSIERIVSACKAHDVFPGLLASAGPVEAMAKQGFKMITLGGDLSFLLGAAADGLRKARSALGNFP